MDSELEILIALSELDTAFTRAQDALTNARGQVAAARENVTEAEAALTARTADRKALQEVERTASRELEQYRTRLARAERALAEGLGAPEAAEKQRVQCLEIIDRLETEMLESMEALDAQAPALEAAQTALARAQEALAYAERTAPEATATALAEARRLKALRDAEHARLPKHLQGRYDLLLHQKPPAVAPMEAGACRKCLFTVPAQTLVDLSMGRVVQCRGCGRWLAPAR